MGLCCWAGFSLVSASRGYALLWCIGFSLWWLLLLQSTGSVLTSTGFAAPWHMGSSRTRDQTHVPCIGRQILHHRASREAPANKTLLKYNEAKPEPLAQPSCRRRLPPLLQSLSRYHSFGRGHFSPFTMLLVGLSYVTFIMLKCIRSVPNLLSFYHEMMLNFIKFYFCIYWGDHIMFFIFFKKSVVLFLLSVLGPSCGLWDLHL